MSKRRALITGITGQDGYYLAEHLLSLDYEVFGMVRRSSRWVPLQNNVRHLCGDLTDPLSLFNVLADLELDEIYNLASQSYVPSSWTCTDYTGRATGLGVANMLEAARMAAPDARFYQAGSSEMFGNAPCSPQDENTPFAPCSPYGAAKVYGHHIATMYRERYGMFVANGILFNHESPRRGVEFVTRKISQAVARIKLGVDDSLALGNLAARRDWGHSRDYVKAMHLMLQQDEPDDFVIATGVSHSVQYAAEVAFRAAGLDWKDHWIPGIPRANDIAELKGDASKAKNVLGWEPETTFEDMMREMVDYDIELLEG